MTLQEYLDEMKYKISDFCRLSNLCRSTINNVLAGGKSTKRTIRIIKRITNKKVDLNESISQIPRQKMRI